MFLGTTHLVLFNTKLVSIIITRGGSRAAVITKRSILDVAAALGPPLITNAIIIADEAHLFYNLNMFCEI